MTNYTRDNTNIFERHISISKNGAQRSVAKSASPGGLTFIAAAHGHGWRREGVFYAHNQHQMLADSFTYQL
jgi:hypothetical protein